MEWDDRGSWCVAYTLEERRRRSKVEAHSSRHCLKSLCLGQEQRWWSSLVLWSDGGAIACRFGVMLVDFWDVFLCF